MQKSDECISLWIIALYTLCVCIPVITFGMIRFLRHKSEIPIKLRDPCITILIVILFLVRIVCKSVLNAYNCDEIMDELIQDIIIPVLLWIPSCLLTYRFRMIHDRINCIFDISTLSWKNILTNNNNTWDNKNYKYTVAIYVIYCIFGCIIQVTKILIMHQYNVTDNDLVTSVLYLPLFLNVIYMKCGYVSPMVRDIYFIKWEEGYIAIFASFYIASIIATNIVARLNDNLAVLFNVIEIACTDIALKSICVIMTIGVCCKISKIVYTKRTNLANKKLSVEIKQKRSASNLAEFMFVESNIKAKKPSKNCVLPCTDKETVLKTILNDNDGLQYYCEHLFSEYTIENFVSFIELHQWLTVYDINDGYSTASDNDANLDQILFQNREHNMTMKGYYNFDFSSEIPTSYINNNSEFTWFDKIKALNDKYIRQYCELQINIPYHIRNKFESFIDLYQFKLDNPGGMNPNSVVSGDFETDLVILDTFKNIGRNSHHTPAQSVIAINIKPSAKPTSKSAGFHRKLNTTKVIIDLQEMEPSMSFEDEPVTIDESVLLDEPEPTQSEALPTVTLELPKINFGTKSANIAVGNNNPIRLQFNQGAISQPMAIHTPQNNNIELKYNDLSETLLVSNTINKTSSQPKKSNQIPSKDLKSKKGSLRSNVETLKSIIKYGFKSGSNMMKNRKKQASEIEKRIKKFEDAKSIDINSFIAVVKETIHVLIKLNYQSIARFMKTKVCLYQTCNILY